MCAGTAGGRVKSGVTLEGVAVGGMLFSRAEEAVREKIAQNLAPLTVRAPAGDYTFCYPEIGFRDNVLQLLRTAKRGEELTASVERTWADAEEQIAKLCALNARAGENAAVTFTGEGFSYTAGRSGVFCDYALSLERALAALKADEEETELVCREYEPEITEEILRARTRPLSSFTTYFDKSNEARVHNIRIAAERISGTVIAPHEEFSFNAAVGKRTAENGFREATVIFDGEFVQGIGGGVCQASTTLFNAALRAGLTVTESRPHSLSVSYVKPSLDAMVSEYSDLKFTNPYDCPVYLAAAMGSDGVTFRFYGLPDGRRYETESVVLFRLPPPPARIVEGEEEKLLRAEKEGVSSESYRLVYRGDTLISRELIRRDNYAVVQGIYQIVPKNGESAPPEGELPSAAP